MTKPFLVLGTYRPRLWKAYEVGEYLTAFTQELGLVPHVDPHHGPQTWCPWFSRRLHAEVIKRTPRHGQSEGWHYDGDLESLSDPQCAIVTWSSATPTQWKWPHRDSIYQPKPFEIVIADNFRTRHRRPPGCPRDRFLFRQRVALPSGLP